MGYIFAIGGLFAVVIGAALLYQHVIGQIAQAVR